MSVTALPVQQNVQDRFHIEPLAAQILKKVQECGSFWIIEHRSMMLKKENKESLRHFFATFNEPRLLQKLENIFTICEKIFDVEKDNYLTTAKIIEIRAQKEAFIFDELFEQSLAYPIIKYL